MTARSQPDRFSWRYGVQQTPRDDWFDPLLTEDTHLYVDPFRIFADSDPRWANGHAHIMKFFNMVFELLADCGFDRTSQRYKKASALLMFKEPPEFCLGVAENSVLGAGSATGLRDGMLEGAREALRHNIEDMRHFEELAIFGAAFGRDRISDVVCNILKADFIRYTQEIARRHRVPLESVPVDNARWCPRFKKWEHEEVLLPVNPYATKARGRRVGVILVPRRFLRTHPSVVPSEFFHAAMAEETEQVRTDFNYEIGQNVDQQKIAQLARRRPRKLRAYLERLERNPKEPYDVEQDPDLIVRRADIVRQIAGGFNVDPPTTEIELVEFAAKLVENYKHQIENRGAWRDLWIEEKPRHEKQAQLLFDLCSFAMCEMHDVACSPETDAGRGPVDFKLSRGSSLCVLLEVKFAKSSSFKRNLANQLRKYAEAEKTSRGAFIVVIHYDKHATPEFMAEAEKILKDGNAEHGTDFGVVWIDARPQDSASRAA